MKKLIKIILLAGIFIIYGCGDDQTDGAGQQKESAKKEEADSKVSTPAASTATATEAETSIAPTTDISSTMPPWAVLEQNVYHYPETKTADESSVKSPSTMPQWAILEQNVYHYPETGTPGMADEAVDMVKEAAKDYVHENQDKLMEKVKEKASEMAK